MQTESEIKVALLDNQKDLARRTILYECAGDYVRGWVAALEWVLSKTPPNKTTKPDSAEP